MNVQTTRGFLLRRHLTVLFVAIVAVLLELAISPAPGRGDD